MSAIHKLDGHLAVPDIDLSHDLSLACGLAHGLASMFTRWVQLKGEDLVVLMQNFDERIDCITASVLNATVYGVSVVS